MPFATIASKLNRVFATPAAFVAAAVAAQILKARRLTNENLYFINGTGG